MPIDVIRPGVGVTRRTVHMVRTSTQMVIKEGRNPDGEQMTVYSAMGICGTETTGYIEATENAKDVTCQRCAARAERELAEQAVPLVAGSHGWDAAPVLGSPEVIQEPPTPPRKSYSPGRARHGRIRYERAERRRKMKEELRG